MYTLQELRQQITIEKLPNGYLKLTRITNGFLDTKKYLGYTKKQAIKHYINYIKSITL